MARNCPNKNDKGNGKAAAKMEATSNMAEQHSKYDEIYMNTLEFDSYATAMVKATRPSTIKAHYALAGTIFINGKKVRVLFDTGSIGANIISAAFVTTYGISCTTMKEPTKILMARKRSRSESHRECTVDLSVHKMQTKGNKILVGNLARYDALIEMLFLTQEGAIIECRGLAIDFPKLVIRINCTPTCGNIRPVIITTEDVMDQHPEVFPEAIQEGHPPLRKIHLEICLKLGTDLGTLRTYTIPERGARDISRWINEKIEQGISDRKMVHGAAPIFAEEKKEEVRMGPLVDLTARNEITIKDDESIPNHGIILNSLGRVRYRSMMTSFMGMRLFTGMWLSMATTGTSNVYLIFYTTSRDTIVKMC